MPRYNAPRYNALKKKNLAAKPIARLAYNAVSKYASRRQRYSGAGLYIGLIKNICFILILTFPGVAYQPDSGMTVSVAFVAELNQGSDVIRRPFGASLMRSTSCSLANLVPCTVTQMTAVNLPHL